MSIEKYVEMKKKVTTLHCIQNHDNILILYPKRYQSSVVCTLHAAMCVDNCSAGTSE